MPKGSINFKPKIEKKELFLGFYTKKLFVILSLKLKRMLKKRLFKLYKSRIWQKTAVFLQILRLPLV